MPACLKIMEIIRPMAFVILCSLTAQCSHKPASTVPSDTTRDDETPAKEVVVGADQMNILLPKLKNKNIALVVNHTSLVGDTHLTDTLMSSGVSIKKVFAPEH